jgi:hypothetical protein
MGYLQSVRKPIVCFVVLALTAFSISWAPAHAAMVGTVEVLKENQQDIARESLHMLLDRSEVRKQLEAWGVNSEEAKTRVDSLTDQEIAEIADQMDQMPAGGGAVGIIVGAALIVFLILLATDILGYTDVFTFVKGK